MLLCERSTSLSTYAMRGDDQSQVALSSFLSYGLSFSAFVFRGSDEPCCSLACDI